MRVEHAGLVLALIAPLVAFFGACSSEEIGGVGGAGGGSSSSSSTSTSTSSSSTSTSTSGGTASFIARACIDDAQCGDDPGARCLQSSADVPAFSEFFGETDPVGGPAGGYCTKDCGTDADCPADARCMGDPNGICVLTCAFGAPPLDFLDDPPAPDKCHGRDELMCTPTQGADAYCIPVCGSDTECTGGRGCDYRVGVCVDNPRQGLPLGAGPCVQDAETDPSDVDACKGFCLRFVDDQQQTTGHMCSGRCSLGGSLQTTMNCGGISEGLCAFSPAFENAGTSENGDYAFCTGACPDHGTCNYQEGVFCFDVGGAVDNLGVGFCFNATECPNGDADCDVDEACTDTKYGPVCLETDGNGLLILPLGDAGVGGGGTGGAGGAGGGAGGVGGAGGATGGAGGGTGGSGG